MTVVHFWEILNPKPTFLCGREPVQGKKHCAPALRVTPDTVAWFAGHPQSCANCLRVARARVAPKPKRKPPVLRLVCPDGGGRCEPKCPWVESCPGPVPNPARGGDVSGGGT